VARLHHPHIIEIYDFAESDEGLSYIITEFVRGFTLKDFIELHRAFFPEVATMITLQICEAVAHAHSLKIIHRDLKPENVMVSADGVLKLMDFGIAKVIDQQQQMTMTGTILGSPAHMAPELLEGHELDFRSDIFSMGTILYWLSVGKLPFTGQNPHQVIKLIVEGSYPDPQQVNPVIGADLSRIIRRALDHDPASRFQTVSAMQTELHACLNDLDIEDIDTELTFFFRQPESYIAALEPRVAKKLLVHGKALIASGKHRQALEVLNRLLALQPEHPEVLDLVDGIHRRHRLKHGLRILSAALSVLLIVAAGIWAATVWLPHDTGEVTDAGIAVGIYVDAGLPAVADQAKAGADPQPRADLQPRTNPDTKKVAIVHHPRLVVMHPFTIVPQPYFERILIDGHEVARNDDKTTGFGQFYKGKLPTGRHRVQVVAHPYADDEFTIEVPLAEEQVRRKLHFLPALVEIDSELADATVYIDGKYRGSAASRRKNPIAFTLEGRRGSRKINIRLVDKAGRELRGALTVTAGKTVVFKATRSQFVPVSDGGRP